MTRALKSLAAIAGVTGLVALAGCGSSTSSEADPNNDSSFGDSETGTDDVGGTSDTILIEIGSPETAGAETTTNPLCGVQHCDPDVPVVCAALPSDAGKVDAPADAPLDDAPDADASDGDSGASDASDADAGPGDAIADSTVDAGIDATDATAATDAALDGTDTVDASDAASSDAGFETAGSGTTTACRVIRDGTTLESACAPAGVAIERAFCHSDADCGPGLTCVGGTDVGQCLAFCCGSSTASAGCQSGRYCTTLPLAARPTDQVPVCAVLDNCELLADPDASTVCVSGSTCTVVTDSGGTACVPIGTGNEYDPCPCEPGFACVGSADDRLCRKMCEDDSTCPTDEGCELLPTFPTGFGVCAVE